MEPFNRYLKRQGFSEGTITSINKNLRTFFSYLKEERITAETIEYSELLIYVNYCSERGNDKTSINYKLRCLRHYFNYLIAVKKRKDNPATELKVRGVSRKLITNLLTEEELRDLYKQYPQTTAIQIRNKVLLGLLIFQGVTTKELNRITEEDCSFKRGVINVSGSRKTNRRELKLTKDQAPLLKKYVIKIRPELIKERGRDTDKLIVNSGVSNSLEHLVKPFLSQLKKVNSKLENLQQIRNSVISEWLNRYDIRQVQYLTGFRYVSSLEKYRQNNLKDLQEGVEVFHPLKSG